MKFFKLTLLLLISASAICNARDIYVAKNGNNSNSGTLASPYQTISKAASVAIASDIVNIRQGTYEETLAPANSGTSGNHIIFQAYPGEDVTITAMQALTGWSLDSGSIYKTTVNWDLGQKNLVMHNGTALDLARWPNNTDGDPWTQNSLRNTGGSDSDVEYNAYLEYSPGIPQVNWENGGSIYFYGDKPGSGWSTWRSFIKSSTPTRVTFDLNKNPSWIRTFHAPGDYGDFWLAGVKGALDYENEWYFDSSSNELYVQLPNGAAPVNNEISMRKRSIAINLTSRNYIEIRNLNVYGGSIEIAGSNNVIDGVVSLYGNWHRGVVSGFSANSQSINLGGSNNIIRNCEIGFGSGTGIWDDGTNNQTLNSYIHDFNYLGDYDAIIMARDGSGTKLIGNTITRGGRDAIQMVSNNCEVSYNDVSYSNMIVDDCGLFYTLGGPRNIEIHHNWFHDAYSSGSKYKAAGIYLDNDSEGFSVHHNVVWNTEWTSIQINLDAADIDIFNNTLWDGSAVMGAWHKAGTSFSDVRVWNNLANDNNLEPQSDKQNNLYMTTDPFVDISQKDFRLNPGTGPIDYGRVIAPITDGFVGSAPDAGAYEYGAPYWVAGPQTTTVAHWKLDETSGTTAVDSSGKSLHGTLTGGISFNTDSVSGQDGKALKFDADTEYVSIGGSNVAPPWTVSVWVARNASPNASAILMHSGSYVIKLEQWPSTNKVGLTQYGVDDYSFDYIAPLDTMVHLALVGTSTDTSLYANGSFVETIAVSIDAPMDSIGASSDALYGVVDDLRVYSEALSSADIKALYDEFATTSDMEKFAVFSSQWLRTDCIALNYYCSGADMDMSGSVDFDDLQTLADQL